MDWRVAIALDVMLAQINERFPNRDKGADGSIGDAAHLAEGTGSDHNPDRYGVVRARDFDRDTNDAKIPNINDWLPEMLRVKRDPRIKYVIANKRIFYGTGWARQFEGNSNAPDWTWLPYYGSNPHFDHTHVSLVPTNRADDTTKWDLGLSAPTPAPQPILEKEDGMLYRIIQDGKGNSIPEANQRTSWIAPGFMADVTGSMAKPLRRGMVEITVSQAEHDLIRARALSGVFINNTDAIVTEVLKGIKEKQTEASGTLTDAQIEDAVRKAITGATITAAP